jgi:multisubunit Na+/H+ antiporter MnhB subunit
MNNLPAFFFEEVWLHRRNRFIAVGGTAVFLLFIAFAIQPVPWGPTELKQTMFFLAGVGLLATTILMIYYAAKFTVVGFAWVLKKAVRLSKHEPLASDEQGKLSS